MDLERLSKNELDNLISNAMRTSDDFRVPEQLTEKLLAGIEKRTLLKELLLDLVLKLGIVFGSLTVLGVVFLMLRGSNIILSFQSFLINNGQLIFFISLIVIVTLLIDQVALKYFATKKQELKWRT